MATGRSVQRGPAGLAALRLGHALEHALLPIMRQVMTPSRLRRLRDLPGPRWYRRQPFRPWAQPSVSPPAELRTVAGIRRDPAAEAAAFAERPVHDWFRLHAEAVAWMAPHFWRSFLPVARRLLRARRAAHHTARHVPGPLGIPDGMAAGSPSLTAELREQALRLGLSAVGVARYDPKFTFAEYAGKDGGHRMVVCVLEQPWEATQRLPSAAAERAALATYANLLERMTGLARWLHGRGFRAHAQDYEGESVFIHYAVQAGLGQLGLNGQLLTPQAGSRCRLAAIRTDAPLVPDSPRDYGIEGLCDKCQACVRRCPAGAIPAVRRDYRGVTKAKLNTKRCLPVVAQVSGCAICMKVCPVQRYGLDAVLSEYEATSRILGTGTDELEGYDWPVDGRHYGPGERPRISRELLSPQAMRFDAARVTPGGKTGFDGPNGPG
jgi:epoxyqueuosine reductase